MKEVLGEENSFHNLMDVYIRKFRGENQPLAVRTSSINRDRTYRVFDSILERFLANQMKAVVN